MLEAVEEVCIICLVVFTIPCARLVGSVTTHCALALPGKEQAQAEKHDYFRSHYVTLLNDCYYGLSPALV